MAYDPTKPANNAPIVSSELRDQFAGLKTLIDAKVSTSALTAAINAQSAGPTTSITYLSMTVSNPPTQEEVQAIADKVDELISALSRV